MKKNSIKQIKEDICEVGHLLWQLGFVASNDGNISVKIDDDRFLITPTGISKRLLKPEMILEINSKGEVLSGNRNYRPTSEVPMHMRCYHDRPDVCSVVHAHPPVATGFAIAHIALDSYIMPEAIVTLGAVPLSKFGAPLTNQTEEAVGELLPNYNAILLMNHGVVTVGESLLSAYYRMETVEHYAKLTLYARLLGGEKELNTEQIKLCLKAHDTLKIPGSYPGYVKGDL